MAQKNAALIESFANGATSGHNYPSPGNDGDPTLEIDQLPDGTTVLVGYGWQKLAERDPDTGEITVFSAWEDWAWENFDSRGEPTTARHVRVIQSVIPDATGAAISLSDYAPKVGSTPESVRAVGHYLGGFGLSE